MTKQEEIRDALISKVTKISYNWDEYLKVGGTPITYDKATDMILTLLSSLGVVIISDDQEIIKHDLNNATYASGYAAAIEDILQSGFVRVESLKKVENPLNTEG